VLVRANLEMPRFPRGIYWSQRQTGRAAVSSLVSN